MAKDEKRSIRDKYNRRLKHLYYALEQYLLFAEERLDESKAGKIRNKEETEDIVEKVKELLVLVPEPKLPVLDFDALFGSTFDETEEILKQGKEWTDSLSEYEVEEIHQFAKGKNT
ncbi:hypothetical protein [Vibrio metschnikovii]|uniref:hypothetical protein n=1 Tax=Vibrio metschnikovii TaxID=28172 RepID=UPI001C2FB190|nr:hypothetical protein [Vibrio metschnikovii]